MSIFCLFQGCRIDQESKLVLALALVLALTKRSPSQKANFKIRIV